MMNLQRSLLVCIMKTLSRKSSKRTGNFSSHVCKEYNNLFGLYDSKSRDYYRFASWEDSVVGYKRMIQYRYRGGNYLHFLKRIGYAEDPRYISKVAQIAKRLYKNLFSD